MILSGKKYACETCIKGHRSSTCRHTERPLFEIKKKGRPVTQCEHCRELRKTKQVHVKCLCESKTSESSSLQGSKSGFERAAFPNGLPKALEALVALQTSTEPSSSDSDHGGVGPGHHCKSGDPCKCVTPKSKTRKKHDSHDQPGPSRSRGISSDAVSNAAIMKRIAELRPVLPRPPADTTSSGGPIHIPSSSNSHAHPQRHHRTGQAPYELAYGMTHQHPLHHQSYVPSPPHSPTFTFLPNDQTFAEQMQLMGMNSEHWNANMEDIRFDNLPFPSLCGCGDDCNCPGCLHHNRGTSIPTSSAYASCTNPGACGTCLDCTIMSLPASELLSPDDTALSIPSAQQEPVNEWLQVSSDPRQNLIPNNLQHWSQSSNSPQNPALMSPNFNYGSSPSPMTSFPNGGTFPQEGRQPSFDPRFLPRAGLMPRGDTHFLNVADPSRSRSPSTSSQSSHQGSEGHGGVSLGYVANGRQQSMYEASQLNGGRRVPSSNPSNGSASSLPHFGS